MTPLPIPFEDHFGLDKKLLQRILGIALVRGADFSEIFLEYKSFNFIKMEEDIIKETAESVSLGAGIRVIREGITGYAYTNDLHPGRLEHAVLTASQIVAEESQRQAADLSPATLPESRYPVVTALNGVTLERKIKLVSDAYGAAQGWDSCIKKITTNYSDQMQHIAVINSEGLYVTDARPLVKMSCVALAEKGSRREAGFYGGGGRVGLEYFEHTLTPHRIGTRAAQEAMTLLEAESPPAGEMPVVLAPGHSGVLIHEAVGHLLESDFIRKKTSVFWDKMGKSVGNPGIDIYDDPTIPYFRGSYNIDDEGTAPRKTALIRAGKVVGLLQDRLSAHQTGASLTGHGRRQDYTCIPIPRMSNTYIAPGNHAPDDIVKSVRRGFYARHYQGGQVEDSGKFTFSVSSGYLIENGRLTAPVKQATLIGSNLDILRKITMVGSDLEFGLQTGTCGKEGQAAPVTDGCPTLKISKMTVGGQR